MGNGIKREINGYDINFILNNLDMALYRIYMLPTRELYTDKQENLNLVVKAIEAVKKLVINIREHESTIEHEIDKINPSHYKTHEMECIDEMLALYGPQTVIDYCVCCVHKYRYRAGFKLGEDTKTDLKKSDWYASKANELRKMYGVYPRIDYGIQGPTGDCTYR